MDITKSHRVIFIFIFICSYSFVIYFYLNKPFLLIDKLYQTKTSSTLAKTVNIERVLIIYVWADVHQESFGNLQYFIRHGVHASQPADYYFILQQVKNKTVNESRLPSLPSNAHYIQHENKCYDYGTIGWFLSNNIVNISLYKYIIFMNSSIRGPFILTYFDDETIWWWYTAFTKRLNDQIKLVGPTINCEVYPHVQSYLMVTDQIGLSILRNEQSKVFQCHNTQGDAIQDGEIPASRFIIQANYQIASLQIKYQGWDFRKNENWNCNNRRNPVYGNGAIDGIGHDPYEIMFIKYKSSSFNFDYNERAHVYQKWLKEQQIERRNLTKTR